MLAELTLPESTPSEAEIRLAEESSRRLSKVVKRNHPLRLTTTDDGHETVEIPAAAAELLVRLLSEMARGNAVTLIPIHAELTTQRVADLLGVSRPFVVKEIDENRLPARKIGTHRRVLFQDLMAYKKRIDAERQRALDELSALDEELGLK
ncbi:MAG: excisionase family DNA-binding protein [Phycisphaerales bacterium]|nr:excisionase family DNA-binding protein [Phycisphaerales bacterium]